jgi:hypothetical protein
MTVEDDVEIPSDREYRVFVEHETRVAQMEA